MRDSFRGLLIWRLCLFLALGLFMFASPWPWDFPSPVERLHLASVVVWLLGWPPVTKKRLLLLPIGLVPLLSFGIIRLFFWKIQTSVPILILVSVATGALVMFLLNIPSKIRNWREFKKIKEQIRSLEEEKQLLSNRVAELTKENPKDS